MAEQDLEKPQVLIEDAVTVGARLRRAREALKLSRADIAARTKIAERHLAAIEEERYSDLASSTYAVGFSRAYARAVNLDEREIAQAVRGELDMAQDIDAPAKPTFEPGDPARVPSLRTAWLAGGAALLVLGAVVVNWSSYIFPASSLPDLTSDAPPPQAEPKPPPTVAAPQPQGPVTITATEEGVWVKITDASGKQLFQKEMANGESFTVPDDAADPQLRTAWPDALAVTVGGRPMAPLADKRTIITVPISAAALLARDTPAPATQAASPVRQAPVTQPAPVVQQQQTLAPPSQARAQAQPVATAPSPAARTRSTPRPVAASTAVPPSRQAAPTPPPGIAARPPAAAPKAEAPPPAGTSAPGMPAQAAAAPAPAAAH